MREPTWLNGVAPQVPWSQDSGLDGAPSAPLSNLLAAPAQEVTDPLLGSTIGTFRIVRELGRGGMGTVYLGEQTVIGSKVAIKFLHPHLASNAALVQRFWAEARSVNVIGHANIISIFDMNVLPPNLYYLVMEYLEGRALHDVADGPMPAATAVPILLQVCDALEAAHRNNVVHRDLKPENIFLVTKGRQENFVKVLDFGIAKLRLTELRGDQTAAGLIIGTPDYMSPEQANGEAVDGRSDLYSLGVIAYQLLTGRLPFSGAGVAALLIAHAREVPTAPHLVNAAVSPALSRVVMQALEKQPARRFQAAVDFAQALEAALREPAPAPGFGMWGEPAGPAAVSDAAPLSRPGSPPPRALAAGGDWSSLVPAAVPRDPSGGPASSRAVPGNGQVPAASPLPSDAPRDPAASARPGVPASGQFPGYVPPGASAAPSTSRAIPPGDRFPATSPASPAPGQAQSGSVASAPPAFPASGRFPAYIPPSASAGPASSRAVAGSGQVPTASPLPSEAPRDPTASARPGVPASGQFPAYVPPGASAAPGTSRPVPSSGQFPAASPVPSEALRDASTSAPHAAPAGVPGPADSPGSRRPGSGPLPVAAPSGDTPPWTSSPTVPRAPAARAPSTRYRVHVTDHSGRELSGREGEEVSRGGLFVCSEGPLPALLTRVRVAVPGLGGLSCEGEVVRHVLAEQARAWGMAPGYGVQFVGLTPAQRQALEGGVRSATPSSGSPPPQAREDRVAAEELARYLVKTHDHYQYLKLPTDAHFEDIRARIRDTKRALNALKERPLSPTQQAQVEEAHARVQRVFDVLGYPSQRLEYDADTGNFAGVARCIAAGLSATDLEAARKRFLARHAGAETNGHIRFVSGQAFENSRSMPEALDSYEKSLRADPLNLRTHHRYWPLKKKLSEG